MLKVENRHKEVTDRQTNGHLYNWIFDGYLVTDAKYYQAIENYLISSLDFIGYLFDK